MLPDKETFGFHAGFKIAICRIGKLLKWHFWTHAWKSKFFGGQKTSGTISENSTTRLVLVCFIGAVVNHPNNLILTVALPSASRVHAVVVYKKRSDSVEIQMNKFPNFDCLDGQSANQRMEIHLTNSTLIDQGNTKRKTCKTAMLPGFCMIEKWWQQRQHWWCGHQFWM